MLVLVLVGGCWIAMLSDDAPPSQRSQRVDMKGDLRFTGTQFVITNNDSFAWTDCDFELNDDYKLSGSIPAGETLTVGGAQFARSDGERFNPLAMKVLRVTAFCDVPAGRGSAFWGEL